MLNKPFCLFYLLEKHLYCLWTDLKSIYINPSIQFEQLNIISSSVVQPDNICQWYITSM